MSEIGHVHDWDKKSKTFRDFCHYVVIEKTCKICGIVHEEASERLFDLNPLQIAFARQDCSDCRRLLAGSEPASWSVPA